MSKITIGNKPLKQSCLTKLIDYLKSRCISMYSVNSGASKYWLVYEMRFDWPLVIFVQYDI